MDTNNYSIMITPTAKREMNRIYEYLSEELGLKIATKNLMRQVEGTINILKYAPQIYAQIEKSYSLEMKYRRIVIKNYVVLYTIDEENKIVYISHMYYKKRNYLS